MNNKSIKVEQGKSIVLSSPSPAGISDAPTLLSPGGSGSHMPYNPAAPTAVTTPPAMPVTPKPVEPKNTKTIIAGPGAGNTRCCVGALLAVSGPYFGKLFPIYLGGNVIGRAADAAVSLAQDPEISNQQVQITYYSDCVQYILTPITGAEQTVYLNGKPLPTAATLSHGDMIKLTTKTTLRFIPACDDTFAWLEHEASEDEKPLYRTSGKN